MKETVALAVEEVKEEAKPDDMEFEEGALSEARRMSFKKPDGISVNVIVSIGKVELNILERKDDSGEELDFDNLLLSQIEHRELLCV